MNHRFLDSLVTLMVVATVAVLLCYPPRPAPKVGWLR